MKWVDAGILKQSDLENSRDAMGRISFRYRVAQFREDRIPKVSDWKYLLMKLDGLNHATFYEEFGKQVDLHKINLITEDGTSFLHVQFLSYSEEEAQGSFKLAASAKNAVYESIRESILKSASKVWTSVSFSTKDMKEPFVDEIKKRLEDEGFRVHHSCSSLQVRWDN